MTLKPPNDEMTIVIEFTKNGAREMRPLRGIISGRYALFDDSKSEDNWTLMFKYAPKENKCTDKQAAHWCLYGESE